MKRVINRLATEIIEHNEGAKDIVFVGIFTGGVYLAERLQKRIKRMEKVSVPMGSIDITLYRDDVFRGLEVPQVGVTKVDFSIHDKNVVLVDDVIYTGRTVRAALDLLTDYGRPRSVQLATLIDRGLRELPIQPDYCGTRVETTHEDVVKLEFKEQGFEEDRVVLKHKVAARAKAKAETQTDAPQSAAAKPARKKSKTGSPSV